ncbi:MAG: ClpX C4-type zinc finger protein, partial [Alistipes sp.]
MVQTKTPNTPKKRGGGKGNGGNNGNDCCSFCGKQRADVEVMFAGSDGANVCNECIANGYKIMVENDLLAGKKPS